MNIITILIFIYITATLAAISSYGSDFHRLNLLMYANLIFFTLIFIPLTIFAHIFYQGYVFLYFFSGLLTEIYPYRVYTAILFVCLYYLLYYLVIRLTQSELEKGRRHMIYFRLIFFSILSIFLFILLYKRTIYSGSIQDYISSNLTPIYRSPAGLVAPLYLLLLYIFHRLLIPKIKTIMH